jgi:DNA mismatch repair protein MSH3
MEIKVAEAKKIVPDNWIRVNGTKTFYRYRSLRIQSKVEELERNTELLDIAATAAFDEYVAQVAVHNEAFREVLGNVATADCLFSLALAAFSNGYCRPIIVEEEGRMEVVAARHPMIEAILPDTYVPNDIDLGGKNTTRQMILTGNNMGGKSSYSRSIALIALLAQVSPSSLILLPSSIIFDLN